MAEKRALWLTACDSSSPDKQTNEELAPDSTAWPNSLSCKHLLQGLSCSLSTSSPAPIPQAVTSHQQLHSHASFPQDCKRCCLHTSHGDAEGQIPQRLFGKAGATRQPQNAVGLLPGQMWPAAGGDK